MRKKYSLHFRLVLVLMVFGFSNNVYALTSFDNDLHYGMVDNTEVKDLQNLLVSKKLYSGPLNGNYYSQTRKAVKNLQEELNIQNATGYFGLKTRTLVNKMLLDATNTVDTVSRVDILSNMTSESDTASPLPILVDVASTTEKLSQSIEELSSRVGLIEDTIGSLSTSVETINNQITTLQALIANLSSQSPGPVNSPPVTSSATLRPVHK